LKWHSTFYYQRDSRPNNFKREKKKMETLTDHEMFEIEGGDWWDIGGGIFDVLMLAAACF